MTLRGYQIDIAQKALALLQRYKIVYIAAEVRCGKTLMALEAAKLYGARSVLFFTKKKAIPSIQKDYNNFGYGYALHVTNYEQAHKLNRDEYDFVVIDEAHSLAAYPKASLRTKHIKVITHDRPVIFLSGTPSPESYSGMYHQLWVSDNSPWARFRNFYDWAKQYVIVKQERRGVYIINDYSGAIVDKVKSDIDNYILTYTQCEAGFICEVKEYFHEVESTCIPEFIKQIYKNRTINFIDDICVAETPAALMSKMHQLCGGAVIADKKTWIFSTEKAEYISEKFKGKRIVIFYKFQAELDILKKFFPETSETPEEFQSTGNPYLSQIISGREGITLDTADAIVMYSIDFAAVSYWQSRARLQSLHRSTPAEVHWIFTRGGIENKIYKAVSAKKDFTLSWFNRQGGINAL